MAIKQISLIFEKWSSIFDSVAIKIWWWNWPQGLPHGRPPLRPERGLLRHRGRRLQRLPDFHLMHPVRKINVSCCCSCCCWCWYWCCCSCCCSRYCCCCCWCYWCCAVVVVVAVLNIDVVVVVALYVVVDYNFVVVFAVLVVVEEDVFVVDVVVNVNLAGDLGEIEMI